MHSIFWIKAHVALMQILHQANIMHKQLPARHRFDEIMTHEMQMIAMTLRSSCSLRSLWAIWQVAVISKPDKLARLCLLVSCMDLQRLPHLLCA